MKRLKTDFVCVVYCNEEENLERSYLLLIKFTRGVWGEAPNMARS